MSVSAPEARTSGPRRIAVNAASILASDVLNRATSFVMYALIARYLGAFAFGQMTLALTLFYVMQVLAVAGVKTVVTREVSRDRASTERYLVSGSVVVAMFSLLSVAVTWIFVRVMGYAPETAGIIVVLSLGLLPYSLSAVCEAVFQAWELMHYIVYANLPWNVLKIVLTLALLMSGHGVLELALVIVASLVAIALFEWWITARRILWPRWRLDKKVAFGLVRSSSTFLGIDVVIAVWAALPVLILSAMVGERDVGIYSSAGQLLMPILLVNQSLVLSIFPLMCRTFGLDPSGLAHIAEHLIELLMALAIPAAVGLYFIAQSALLLVYGENDFAAATLALRIMLIRIVLEALTSTLGRVLFAADREGANLRIVTVNAVVTLVLGVALIAPFGVTGAAVAVASTAVLNTVLHFVSTRRLLAGIAWARTLWMPLLASAVMGLYLQLFAPTNILLAIPIAATIYLAAHLALATLASGGVQGLKHRYAYLWPHP